MHPCCQPAISAFSEQHYALHDACAAQIGRSKRLATSHFSFGGDNNRIHVECGMWIVEFGIWVLAGCCKLGWAGPGQAKGWMDGTSGLTISTACLQ